MADLHDNAAAARAAAQALHQGEADGITIEIPGHDPVRTTSKGLDRAAAAMELQASTRKPGHGHNSGAAASRARQEAEPDVGGLAVDRLRSIIERRERLEEERRALGDDIKDINAEAKSAGFDLKAIAQIIKERKQEPAEVEEHLSALDLYRRALGM